MSVNDNLVNSVISKFSMVLLLLLLSSQIFAQATFTPLGLMSNYGDSKANDVSADGSVITGIGNDTAFRWSAWHGVKSYKSHYVTCKT